MKLSIYIVKEFVFCIVHVYIIVIFVCINGSKMKWTYAFVVFFRGKLRVDLWSAFFSKHFSIIQLIAAEKEIFEVLEIDNIGRKVSSQTTKIKIMNIIIFSYYIINSDVGSKANRKWICFCTSCIFKHIFGWKLSVVNFGNFLAGNFFGGNFLGGYLGNRMKNKT